ncbi:MAG: glycoside hydrolase family protein [Caulobacter sp.]|nr:glycoside hydrolase family protein [Caulobacter sp.]
MKPRHQVSRAAIELIKKFEGYRQKAAQLPDGRWTIGFGHTLTAREGAEVSEADAEALLLYDLIAVAHAVNEHSYTPLTQNQFDSLCCFAFNVGVDNFRRSSVLRRVNEGQMLQAACAMEMWRKADFEGERIVIDALVRRRAAEKTLFLTPANGWVPAPSPVLRPRVDYDAVNAVPREAPTAVKASLTGDRTSIERDHTPRPQPVTPPDQPLASEIAAADVGARLEKLLPEAVELAPRPAPEPEPEPEPEAPSAPVAEPVETPPPVDLPPVPPLVFDTPIADEIEPAPETESVAETPSYPEHVAAPVAQAMVGDDAHFTLTPAPDGLVEPTIEPAAAPDYPEPTVETGPGLFDVALAENETPAPTRPLVNEDYVRRLVQQDEMASLALDGDFPEMEVEPVRFSGLPLVIMAVGGIVLFAGGIAWGFAATGGQGVLNPRNLGWLFAVIGIGLFGGATWLGLNKFLGAPMDDEEDEVEEAEQEPYA